MTAQTLTLADFLLARIAEDEETAQDATNDGHRWLVEEETISLWPDDLDPASGVMLFPRKAHAYHAATWEPARVLAECEAKRRMVERLATEARTTAQIVSVATLASDMLTLLAQPYADHPDFRPEWRA
jgi:hypothetical protein